MVSDGAIVAVGVAVTSGINLWRVGVGAIVAGAAVAGAAVAGAAVALGASVVGAIVAIGVGAAVG